MPFTWPRKTAIIRSMFMFIVDDEGFWNTAQTFNIIHLWKIAGVDGMDFEGLFKASFWSLENMIELWTGRAKRKNAEKKLQFSRYL